MSTELLKPPAPLQILIDLSLAAGRAIMAIYATDFAAKTKADASPVTEADQVAEDIIIRGLAEAFPQIPVVAEEMAAAGKCGEVGGDFFLVDPLDGTKEFLSRNGEFTVNIALVRNGTPVQGVVYAPAIGQLWWGDASAGAATGVVDANRWTRIIVRAVPAEGAVVVASRSHRDEATEDYLKTIKVQSIASRGSSLKFCLVAEGKADLYPRFGRTMEWDTAAGHAVLAAAGGKSTNVDGTAMIYGKWQRGFENDGFIAGA